MHRYLRRLFAGLIFCLAIVFYHGQASAVYLSLDPVVSNVTLDSTFTVDIFIGNLEDIALGTFDLTLLFDDRILDIQRYELGTELNDGNQVYWDPGDLGGGAIDIGEWSWLSAYELSTQPDSFSLASVTFVGRELGISPLDLTIYYLGDEYGDPIDDFEMNSGEVRVSAKPIPEPGSFFLLSAGLLGLLPFKKQFINR